MVVALALVLTLAVAVLRVLAPNGADAPGVLLIVPVAICAMRFGIRGGIGAACVGMALAVATNVTMDTNQFTWLGYGTRAAALFLVGALVGSFVDRGRELESELAPHRNLSLDLIATADFDGRFTSVNGAWGTTLGYGRDELLGSPLVDLVHPDDREATIAEQRKLALLGEDTLNFHNRCRHRDGSYRWLEWMIRPDVRTASFYAIARDVTTRKEAEESLRQLLEQLAIIQRAIAERSRLDEILDTIVKAAAKVLATEIVGLRLIDENDPSYLVLAASTGVDERSARVLRRGPVTEGLGGRAIVEERLLISNTYGRREGDIKMLAADGLRAAMAAPVYGHGEIVGSLVVATHSDHQFTEAEADTLGFFAEYAGVALSTARAADAVRQALTDPLTGLPNRALFIDRLDHALARAERADGEVSVLFLDVDEFKLVNDSLGHLAGDRLLVEAARRIRKCLRHSETAARLGGDEFAILIAHENDPVPEILGARIIEALSAPLDVDGHEIAHAREHRHRDGTHATRRACCATPTPRCTAPRPRSAAASASSSRACRPTACASSSSATSSCAPSRARRSPPCISRSSRCQTAASARSRCSRAGTTPRAARFRPTSSSPSPRAPGSSTRSARRSCATRAPSWPAGVPGTPGASTCR